MTKNPTYLHEPPSHGSRSPIVRFVAWLAQIGLVPSSFVVSLELFEEAIGSIEIMGVIGDVITIAPIALIFDRLISWINVQYANFVYAPFDAMCIFWGLHENHHFTCNVIVGVILGVLTLFSIAANPKGTIQLIISVIIIAAILWTARTIHEQALSQ